MRFANPQWLWALLLVPALYLSLVWDSRKRRAQFARFADAAVWKVIAPEIDWGARARKGRFWLMALALVFAALARPQWGQHEESVTVTGMDVMVVLDVSNSMEVEDVVPSRAKKAKHAIRSIVERLEGDRIGMVAFAGSAFVVSPLTTDVNYLYESLEIVGPKMVSSQGTDIGGALETAARALDRGAENPSGEKGVVSRAVILVSDGEDHEAAAVAGAKKLAEAGVRLYVLGIGTSKGGPVPVRDDRGQLHGFKRDRDGTPVVSTFKPEALMEVAAAADGRYWTVTPGEAEVDELLGDLGALARGEFAERKFVVHEDRFQWPLLLAIVLLLVELGVPARLLAGRGAAALLLAFWTPSALAGSGRPSAPIESYLKNQQGLRLFEQGKVDEAQQRFGEAQALDPTLPELQFNQGVVNLKKGDAEQAARGFETSAREALQRNDAGLAARSFYNQGIALTQKGDVEGAVRAYRRSIGSAKTAGDAELEADTRKNLELLLQQAKQQQQKKQQQEQQKGAGGDKEQQQKSPDSKDGQGDPEKQKAEGEPGSKDGEGGKDGRKAERYQDPSKGRPQERQREFKSQKLSKEDADRVMAELANKERDVQARLKKQKGTPRGQQKDW